ncbi:MAG: DUF975 family protein [Clostridiales Family XIII bacterium]|jgi:uncharacterized membrane protein|nr:DUF975 family protein [Clostridiales Family XIII bacterium]
MEQHIFVTEPARQVRQAARDALRGRWKQAITVYTLFLALLNVPYALLYGIFDGYSGIYSSFSKTFDFGAIAQATAPGAGIIDIYPLIIGGPLILGITLYALETIRGRETDASIVMSGFNNFGRALGLYLLMLLFVFLWTLLVIVPGIIAAFAYAQAFFLLSDNPNMGLNQALKTSRRMMVGNKGKLFCLGISFIGWLLLTGVVFSLVSYGISVLFADANRFVPALLIAILRCPIWAPIGVYFMTSTAVFYEFLTGRRRPDQILGSYTIEESRPEEIRPEEIRTEEARTEETGEEETRAEETRAEETKTEEEDYRL